MNKLIIDANYNPYTEEHPLDVQIGDGNNQVIVNGDGSLRTESFSTFSFLNNILKELKIMNIHLSLMTDQEITSKEIE